MFITTRRETARVDAFIAAMRGDVADTVALPRIVATSSAPLDDRPLVDSIPTTALAVLLLSVLVALGTAVAVMFAPATVVEPGTMLDTTERVVELPTGAYTR